NRLARAFFREVVAVRRSKPLSQPRRESGVVPIERTATLRTVPGSAGVPPAVCGRDARGPQNCSPERGCHESLLRRSDAWLSRSDGSRERPRTPRSAPGGAGGGIRSTARIRRAGVGGDGGRGGGRAGLCPGGH